jgi:hypothetical protein
VLDAGANVRAVDALGTEELIGHAGDRRRAVDVQIGNAIRALIPPLQDEPPVVHAMVVVEMGEEGMRHLDRPASGLQQPVMRARAVIPDDDVAAGFAEIAGTLTVQRG